MSIMVYCKAVISNSFGLLGWMADAGLVYELDQAHRRPPSTPSAYVPDPAYVVPN